MTLGSNPVVMVPARLGAGRLPDKPMLDIAGEPLIVHVWRRAVEAAVGPVVVAAADRPIAAAIEAAGGRAILTDPDLPTGSDRIAAALRDLDPHRRHDIIVNLQGDLPTIAPTSVVASIDALAFPGVEMATLGGPLPPSALDDPHVVKVTSADGIAIDFCRRRPAGAALRHIGIYAYRREAIERFARLPRGRRELRESLEQLRAMESGMRIAVGTVEDTAPAVDTPDSLGAVRRLLISRHASGRP